MSNRINDPKIPWLAFLATLIIIVGLLWLSWPF